MKVMYLTTSPELTYDSLATNCASSGRASTSSSSNSRTKISDQLELFLARQPEYPIAIVAPSTTPPTPSNSSSVSTTPLDQPTNQINQSEYLPPPSNSLRNSMLQTIRNSPMFSSIPSDEFSVRSIGGVVFLLNLKALRELCWPELLDQSTTTQTMEVS